MEKVATVLRFLQFYSHLGHNLVKGDTFFEDHDFLGGLYPVYEAAYDSVVERMIGLGLNPNFDNIHKTASDMLAKAAWRDTKQGLAFILTTEKTLTNLIEKEVTPNPMTHPHGGEKPLTQGTIQLLGDIANASEVRQYKLGQKLKV